MKFLWLLARRRDLDCTEDSCFFIRSPRVGTKVRGKKKNKYEKRGWFSRWLRVGNPISPNFTGDIFYGPSVMAF